MKHLTKEQKTVFYKIFEYHDTAKLYSKVLELTRLNIRGFNNNFHEAAEHYFYIVRSRHASRMGFYNMENLVKIFSMYEHPIEFPGMFGKFMYRMKIKKMLRQIERDISWFE